MTALAVGLLALGVGGAVLRPGGLPAWAVPTAAAVAALAAGLVTPHQAGAGLRPLVAPLAFLLAAVPLGALLDELGFFSAVAAVLGTSRHLGAGLWAMAGAVTAVLNLDASVVLLTPLYVRVARRSGLDERSLAFQPVLLASLASSGLPVSNLTNLIAASRDHLGTLDFVSHLGLPTVVATTVGWFAYRHVLPPGVPVHAEAGEPDRRALVIGAGVVGAVLLGFTLGEAVGVAPWEVAVAADVVLVCLLRRLPLRVLPWGTALVAAALGLLAVAVVDRVPLDAALRGEGVVGLGRTVVLAALGAAAVNNLPALLVGLPALGAHPSPRVWALLLGVNMGPLFVVTGSLAGLLWLDSVGRLGVEVRAVDYSRVGARVGLPALLAAVLVLGGLRALGG